jgi:hypothetical protein
MTITRIEFGSIADPEIINNNFEYLDEKVTETSSKIYMNNASLESQIASQALTFNENITSIIQKIYPVGSIYIGVTDTCPIAELFGTWEKVSSGRVLQGTSGSQKAGNTVEAGLPNITGGLIRTDYEQVPGGALYQDGGRVRFTDGTGNYGINVGFDASRSNAIYGRSNTVQPPAYLVNIWRRVA